MAAGPGPGVANSALVLSWAIINFHDSVNPALPHWQPYPGGPRNLKRAGRTWFPRTKAADDRPDSRRTPGLDRRHGPGPGAILAWTGRARAAPGGHWQPEVKTEMATRIPALRTGQPPSPTGQPTGSGPHYDTPLRTA